MSSRWIARGRQQNVRFRSIARLFQREQIAPSVLRTSPRAHLRTAGSVARSGSHLLFEMLNLHWSSLLCLAGVGSILSVHAAEGRFLEVARKVNSQ